MLNRINPKTKEDGASTVVGETAMVTCETTGEVTGDEVVNRSTIEKSVEPETEELPPDGESVTDENKENSSDKEEEKEPGEED